MRAPEAWRRGKEPRRSQCAEEWEQQGGLARPPLFPTLSVCTQVSSLADDAQLSYSPETASCSRPLYQQPATVSWKHPWEAVAVVIATLTHGAPLGDRLGGEPLQQPEAVPEITDGMRVLGQRRGRCLPPCRPRKHTASP